MKRFTLTAAHVVDENGDPVIGATILVKGTTLGTVTDFDGNFTLDVPAEHKHLQISYVGMETQEVRVASNLIPKLWMKSWWWLTVRQRNLLLPVQLQTLAMKNWNFVLSQTFQKVWKVRLPVC